MKNKKNVLLLSMITVFFLLMSISSVTASPSTVTETPATSINSEPSSIVEPDGITLSWVGAYITKSSSGTALWYSGNLSSNYPWVSASIQVSLQWQSPLGGSWQTEFTQQKLYSEDTAYMETPTYLMSNATWGYWRSYSSAVIYWPVGQIPNYSTGSDISSTIYIEPTYVGP